MKNYTNYNNNVVIGGGTFIAIGKDRSNIIIAAGGGAFLLVLHEVQKHKC